MNTIRIKRKVKSTLLKIRELEKYKGKNIALEIINQREKQKKNKSFAGIFSSYSNVNLIDEEKSAWVLAVSEKHENYRR